MIKTNPKKQLQSQGIHYFRPSLDHHLQPGVSGAICAIKALGELFPPQIQSNRTKTGNLSLRDAVNKVRAGSFYEFVDMLSEEEKAVFDSLSQNDIWVVFEKIKSPEFLGIQAHFWASKDAPIDEKKIQRAHETVSRIIEEAAIHGLTRFILVRADSYNATRLWHTDGFYEPIQPNETDPELRLVWAIKGDTTEFIVLTEEERRKLAADGIDRKSMGPEIERIAQNDPARIGKGNRYDISIFSTKTIHCKPSHQGPDRTILSIFGDKIPR